MKVRVTYSSSQLEEAVKFVARNNEVVQGRTDYVKEQILSLINESARKFPRCPIMGTLGFTIVARDITKEDMDHDENYVFFDVLIDPALGSRPWEDDSDNNSHICNVISKG